MNMLARKSISEKSELEESFFQDKPTDDIMGEISFNMLTKNTAFKEPSPESASKSPLSAKVDQSVQVSDPNFSDYLEH
jgi:dTDP-D-glucose 4,6-dehydratase